MNRALPFVVLAVLILAGSCGSLCIGDDNADGSTDTAVVDPDVLQRIDEDGEAFVVVGLRESDIPLLEQTVDEAMAHTATVQAGVLSVLTEDDFRLTHQFPATPALAGYITMSGLEKLRTHPDVRFIELDVAGRPAT